MKIYTTRRAHTPSSVPLKKQPNPATWWRADRFCLKIKVFVNLIEIPSKFSSIYSIFSKKMLRGTARGW